MTSKATKEPKKQAKKKELEKLTYTVTDFNLDERCEFNDVVWDKIKGNSTFSFWVWAIREATDLEDEIINTLDAEDIVALGRQVIDTVNKKK